MTKNEILLAEVQHVRSFLQNAEAALTAEGSSDEAKARAASVGVEAAHEGFGQLLKMLADAKGSSTRPWLDGVDRIEEVNRERSARETEATAAGKTVN